MMVDFQESAAPNFISELNENPQKRTQWLYEISHLPQTETIRLPQYDKDSMCGVNVVSCNDGIQCWKHMKWDDGCVTHILVPRGTSKEIDNCCTLPKDKDPKRVKALLLMLISLIGYREPNPDGDGVDDYYQLSSVRLKRISQKVMPYAEALDILRVAGMIEVNPSYKTDDYCKGYRLTEWARDRAIDPFDLSELEPKGFRIAPMPKDPEELESYLLWSYGGYRLPTLDAVVERAKEWDGQKDHSGRFVIYADDFDEDEAKNRKLQQSCRENERRVLNDDIAAYARLLKNGLVFPHTSVKCPRVFDSFNALPYWIRNMVTIDGFPIAELDFSSLHPNLMFKALRPWLPQKECDFFNAKLSGDCHGGVASLLSEEFGANFVKDSIDDIRQAVKKEHLSYFNDEVNNRQHYAVHSIYIKHMPVFTDLVNATKVSSHKDTSRILFSLEAQLMTEICRRFYTRGIRAIYVFDALYVPSNRQDEARSIANQVAEEFGLTTGVEISRYSRKPL